MQVGQVIGGRLRVERVLGVGGFGVVAAATHLELQHQVAIKMLKREFAHDEEIVERFLREARAVAALRTEHVCRVYDVGRTDDGTPYIVMELLQGGDVMSMIAKKPLPVATAVDFAMQACVALAEAHARGIVHRDLKPPNIFVMRRPDGGPLVKVLDFGIAKAADELRLTHSMAMLGSPQYMSPEQLTTPREVDARTDIWSLGVTLYHMIARRLPFPSAQIGELAVMITSEPPQPLDGDPALAAVIYRCLEKQPAARFADVAELAAALVPFGGPTARAYAALVRTPTAVPPTSPGAQAQLPAAGPGAQHVATLASVATGTSPMGHAATLGAVAPPATPSPGSASASAPGRRGRAFVWIPIGALLVGVGVLAGYLARGSPEAPVAASAGTAAIAPAAGGTPDATAVVDRVASDAAAARTTTRVTSDAAEAAPADAGASPRRPRPADPRAGEPDRLDPDVRRQLEEGFANVERMLEDSRLKPAEVQNLQVALAEMGCALRDRRRVMKYYPKLAPAGRAKVVAMCKQHDIELSR